MVQVEINDEVVEAKLGERLLNIARRNGSHIGFYCDGHGLCTMCECKVLSGADQLSTPNETEHVWLNEERLAAGYRLGCQTALRGAGPVRVLTRAEEIRRQLGAVLSPPAGTTAAGNLRPLLDNLGAVGWQHIGRWPANLLHGWRRNGLIKLFWPVNDLNLLIEDTARITRRQLAADRAQIGAAPEPPRLSGPEV